MNSYGTDPKLVVNMKVDTAKLKELMDKFKATNPMLVHQSYSISPVQVAIKEFKIKEDMDEWRLRNIRYMGNPLYTNPIKNFYALSESAKFTPESVRKFHEEVDKILPNKQLRILSVVIGVLIFMYIWSTL